MRRYHPTDTMVQDALPPKPSAPRVLVLDNVRSAYNVGAILRTSDALGVAHVHLCGITATPPHPQIRKAALGAERAVPWSHHPTTLQALALLRQAGYQRIAIEQAPGARCLSRWRSTPQQPYAFVLGNEVTGLDPQVLAQADACVEIPQQGMKKSLNVATCAGIVLWQTWLT